MYAQQQIRSMTVALALGIGLLAVPVQAQETAKPKPAPAPVRDHLKCYDVEPAYYGYNANAPKETKYVNLKTDLSFERCNVNVVPDLFCLEASKFPNHDKYDQFGGTPAGQFLCHELSYCQESPSLKGKVISVSDQFGFGKDKFKLKIKKAELLCAPAELHQGGGKY